MVSVPILKGSKKKMGSNHISHFEEHNKNDHINNRQKISLCKDIKVGNKKKSIKKGSNCVQSNRNKIIEITKNNDKMNNENIKYSDLKEKKKKRFSKVFVKTINMLFTEIFIKSFQTMLSYAITSSFFILLNLYMSSSCKYEEIAGFGVSLSIISLLNSVVEGFCSSLDYFCSQSIGIKDIYNSFLFLNSAYFLFFIFYVLLVLIFFLIKLLIYYAIDLKYIHIFMGIELDNDITQGYYFKIMDVFFSSFKILLFSFYPYFLFESTRRFLILHNNIYPSLFTSFFSFFVLNFFCYIFVFIFSMSHVGVSLAWLVTNIISCLFIFYFLRNYIQECSLLLELDIRIPFLSPNSKSEENIIEPVSISSTNNIDVHHYFQKQNDHYHILDIEENHNNNKKQNLYKNEILFHDKGDILFENSQKNDINIFLQKNQICKINFLFFHIPSKNIRNKFLNITKTNIKNIFFEILSFEMQLFESAYLNLTSVAVFIQINNMMGFVYNVSHSYGIFLAKLMGIYISRKNRIQEYSKKNIIENKKNLSDLIDANIEHIILYRMQFGILFILLLLFLYTCLAILYIYHEQIITFFYSNIEMRNYLIKVFFIITIESLLEVLAAFLNNIIKGLGLQDKISFFTFLNFMLLMQPFGLILTFGFSLDIYGFIYSTIISMIIQISYLSVFIFKAL
ncbi:multidrug efflux pump, putative [Plasmodium berghei]|uniref:Multidrug efflux pump, putative n=2 Tax=Plasmodium berghei TaxID=5821 RepID=A0A509AFA4_PLABA|nr:multidrug efflux pump, putative [Plasmodium berghei ANKA]CXH94978.1 multidrug efflux pump, putative [Plasmodium berghei]SCL90972.1 multidrug efflux pump, putative [Plasmodium berghei]SCM15396.1 multidrug efflux pump, putative [Plasmodium berghei]SCM17190.1 multidrug efflux pump, putative [Plasmodium berghei]SCN22237.1 multidrug efflux pump, putative [Plasmodium berghei]|eukprot:XP_034419980.1 multidrug efflux pump, putative [Plasmodium berghei ANKA]